MPQEQFSNVDTNLIAMYGNTGVTTGFLEPAIVTAAVLVPKGTIIPASAMVSQSVFNTYVQAALVNDDNTQRWRMFTPLDKFEDKTKAPSSEDTGLFQTMNVKFNTLYSFRLMLGMGNFIENVKYFQNCQDLYDVFFIDQNGTIQGTTDSTGAGGLQAFYLYQFFVEDRKAITVANLNQYTLSIGLGDRAQMNEDYAQYVAGLNILALEMPESVQLYDVTDIVSTPLSLTSYQIALTGKYGQLSQDLVASYGTVIAAASATAVFADYDLTAGAANVITAISKQVVTVAGQLYNCIVITITTNTATHVNQISMKSISATEAVLPNVWLSNEANAYAYHTF